MKSQYSVSVGARDAIDSLVHVAGDQLPPAVLEHLKHVEFSAASQDGLYFPCPFKESEAAGALKAVEASVLAAIADLRYGKQNRRINVNMERTAAFLFSTYIATIGGLGKQDPNVKAKLKDTDLLAAQSNLYRRMSANLYETKTAGEYYHIHGSLEAGRTLNMIGLESHRPDLTDYHEIINVIESHVKQFTVAELEIMNAKERQAGVQALKWEDFKQTDHGQALLAIPPWQVKNLETSSPRAPFPTSTNVAANPKVLAGIRVLELCRIIAGPAIGRTLAEYGASVIKVTSPHLSDVPFFQVDGNTGKHTVELDLKTDQGREVFENLLMTADVVLDGYRPGALGKLGYSPAWIAEKVKSRGRGIVYVAEDCFGPSGEWAGRPGWQQIADCASGIAWAQGQFMGLNEPVVPPFPMSDYGTGCMGAIAALIGLYKRAEEGGSWIGRTSLCQYDVFLLGLGLYGHDVAQKMKETHDKEFFDLRHADSVDEVGGRALRSMKRCHPELFDKSVMQEGYSNAYKEKIRWVRSAISVSGVGVGFERASRPNGYDAPSWDVWEIDEEIVNA